VLEAEEFFSKGQKGSSAMPHKRNPITGERLTGLARVLRGNSIAALENVALWHERDISHSSVERVIFPDSCTLLDYMLVTLASLTEGLLVYPENMKRNLSLSLGMWNSQSVLLALIKKGLTREEAYELVQRNAMKTWQAKHAGTDGADFLQQLQNDPEVARHFRKENWRSFARWISLCPNQEPFQAARPLSSVSGCSRLNVHPHARYSQDKQSHPDWVYGDGEIHGRAHYRQHAPFCVPGHGSSYRSSGRQEYQQHFRGGWGARFP
jgi:hypothetical protein